MKKIYKILFLVWVVFSVSCGDSGVDSDNQAYIPGSSSGQGGSLARFAINGNNLYTINRSTIQVFDVSDRSDIVVRNRFNVGFGIETLFPYENHLFIGAEDGMYIYDITDESNPIFLSNYWHITSCDPVVVQDNYAYVTLRISECQPSLSRDELQIIDISNKADPIQISSYTLEEPYGLGISGDLLFVCEGDNGLSVFDVSDPFNVDLMKRFQGINAYDVIPNKNILILTGSDGIKQYDFTDPQNIYLISQLYTES